MNGAAAKSCGGSPHLSARSGYAANAVATYSQYGNFGVVKSRGKLDADVCVSVQQAYRPRSAAAYERRRVLGVDGLPSLRLPAAMRKMRAVRPSNVARPQRGGNRGASRGRGLIAAE